MEVGNVVEEEPTHPAQKVAVNCRGGTSLEVPLRLAIMRQCRVRMVEVRDHDEPGHEGVKIGVARGECVKSGIREVGTETGAPSERA